MNGVDWIGNATHGEFTYTGSAAPDLVAPSSGPRHGGTNFYLGILPRPPSHMLASAGLAACRLGNDTQPASFDQQRGGLRCATPLLTPPAAVGEYPVYATINGQQFEPSPSATWRYVYSVQDLLSGNTASGGGGASPSPPSAPPSAPPPLGTPGSGAADLTQVGSGLAGSGTSPSSPLLPRRARPARRPPYRSNRGRHAPHTQRELRPHDRHRAPLPLRPRGRRLWPRHRRRNLRLPRRMA